MTDSALEPGSLLANRYRVVSDRPEGNARFRVIDTRDELSAGAKWVRLLVVRGIAPGELESALRRSLRYAIGVRGLAELLGVVELAPGESAVAYALPDGKPLDESLSLSEGRPWDAARVERVSSSVSRVLAPLHE